LRGRLTHPEKRRIGDGGSWRGIGETLRRLLTATFFLACLAAMEFEGVMLDDI